MVKRKATAEELEARAESNGYKRAARAAGWGHETVAKLLLEKGAELESEDKDG